MPVSSDFRALVLEAFVLRSTRMHQLVRRLFKEADGKDIVESTFLATFVAIASFTILISIGGNVGGSYEKVDTTVASANRRRGGAALRPRRCRCSRH